METIRGIPNRYLYTASLALSFLLFYAGGTAFDQSPLYGGIFFVPAVVLFCAAVRLGRRYPGKE